MTIGATNRKVFKKEKRKKGTQWTKLSARKIQIRNSTLHSMMCTNCLNVSKKWGEKQGTSRLAKCCTTEAVGSGHLDVKNARKTLPQFHKCCFVFASMDTVQFGSFWRKCGWNVAQPWNLTISYEWKTDTCKQWQKRDVAENTSYCYGVTPHDYLWQWVASQQNWLNE